MSSPAGTGLGPCRSSFKRKCPYKEKFDACMDRLEQARAQLQAVLEEQRVIHERTNVLCDMISTQACVMEQLGKHSSWLHSISPEQPLQAVVDSTSAAAVEAAAELAFTQHQDQYRQHTCVRLVEAATPQLLQQVLSMTTLDWVRLCRCHFRELAVLLELVNRPPQVYRDDPSAFAAAAAVAASLAAQTDAAAGQYAVDSATPRAAASPAAGAVAGADYQQQMPRFEPQPQEQTLSGSAAISDSTEDAAAAALSTDDCSLPWDQDPMRLLVAALCRQGARFHAALVHRSVALLEAGSMNQVTLQPEMPSLAYWRRAVDRLHLSPSQVLHFKVAAQEYRRLTRAAAAAGLDLVQITKNFALSDVAAKYAEDSEQPADAAANPSTASLNAQPSSTTAAAPAGPSSASLQSAAIPTATGASAAAETASFMDMAGSGSSGSELSGSSGGVHQQGAAAGAAAAEDSQINGMSALQQLDAKLQRHLNSLFLNMYLVNTFCTNVLTPYQHAVMRCASYPYCPVLGAMAEALEKLPPSEVMHLPAHVQARVQANIEQHTACRTAVMEQQRKDLCWWEP